MKNKLSSSLICDYKVFLLLLFFLPLIGVQASEENQKRELPVPTLDYGNAFITGTIDMDLKDSLEIEYLLLYFHIPITTGDILYNDFTYQAPVQEDGTFELAFPVFCEALVNIRIPGTLEDHFILVASGKENKVTIHKRNGKIEWNIQSPFEISPEELSEAFQAYVTQRVGYTNDPEIPVHSLKAYGEAYLARERVDSESIRASSLSEAGKSWIIFQSRSLKLYHMFENLHLFEEEESLCEILQNFELGNPYFLYSIFWGPFMQELLTNKALQIPEISEQPVDEWIAATKEKVSKLTNVDQVWFYDVLALSSYYSQLLSARPLTEAQKHQITRYFQKNGLDQFLLEINETAYRLSQVNRKLNIRPTPTASAETMLEKIVENYRGKMVFVDFWATWCVPCMNAFKKFEPIKKRFNDKNVVFVYITCTSSPQREFEKTIPLIGGDHYYLEEKVFKGLYSQYDFNAIPAYLLFDTQGNLVRKRIGFSSEIENWLEEYLGNE